MCGSDLCVLRRWGSVRWGEVCVSEVCGSEGGEVRCVDRRSKTVKGGRKTHRRSAFGSVIGLPWRIGDEVRWGDVWIGGLNRSKVEGKLIVGLRLARWSDYHEGLAVRWARRDRSRLDWRLVRGWALSFSRSLSLLRVEGNGLKVKWICKTISGSNEQNFGQTEIIFRKFYFL